MSNTGVWLRVAGPYRVLSANRSFRFLFVAQTLSAFIDWLYIVALFALAYHITHSPTVVALLTFTRLLPYAILSPFSGALSDRYSRATLMASACAGRATCMLGLVLVTSRATLPLAFVLVFLSTALSSMFKPAMLSTVPGVVHERDLIDANSVLSQIDMISLGAGPGIAAVILLIGSARLAFIVSAVGLLAASLAVVTARIDSHRHVPADARGDFPRELAQGYRFLIHAQDRALLGVVVAMGGLTMEGGAMWAILVDLSEGPFHLGDGGTGLLMMAYAAGGLLAGFLVGRAIIYGGIRHPLVAGCAGSSLAFLGIGLSPRGLFPFACLFLVGLADVVGKVPGVTAMQSATPDEMLGRVFGAVESSLVFAMVLGSLIVAPLIATVGSRVADVIVAVLGLILLTTVLPWIRHLDADLGIRIFLRQMPVLNLVSFERLDDLLDRLRTEHFGPGEDIIREGDMGDRMYVINRGKVEVVVQGDSGMEKQLALLSRMDCFGEIALLRGTPRNATVRAIGSVDLFSLSRNDFEQLRQGASEFEDAMQSLVAERDFRRLEALFPAARL